MTEPQKKRQKLQDQKVLPWSRPEVRSATGLEIFMFLSMHAIFSPKPFFCQIC